MIFTLRHFDTPLLQFSATMDSSTPEISILWTTAEHTDLLPLDLHLTPEGLFRWLRSRTIPRNRAYMDALVAKLGLSPNRPMDILLVSKGLSLNDCYWVVPEGFEGSFASCNLYDNKFSAILAWVAFTGYGSDTRTSLVSSPELTTNGILPKCWRRLKGEIRLYKGGTTGASNTGNEPYSEYYAWQVAKTLELNAVPYSLAKWKKILCSTCTLFTSKEYAFLPVGRMVTSGGFPAVLDYYAHLDQEFQEALKDMLLFDAIICNTDRHFGNFGFLVDTRTNRIVAPAPLFDHGNSLLNLAPVDIWDSFDKVERYASTLRPAAYPDFFDAGLALGQRQRDLAHRLMTFKLCRHSRYNLHPRRLKMLERLVQARARHCLEL